VLVCSGCGGRAPKIEEVRERTVRDLPWRKYQAIVVVEFYRVRCRQCGLKVEQVPQLPGKAPFSQGFRRYGWLGVRIGVGASGGPGV
jgi:transposase